MTSTPAEQSPQIIGYQVQNSVGDNWADRPSFVVLDAETAIADLLAARKADCDWVMIAILEGDIEEPSFEPSVEGELKLEVTRRSFSVEIPMEDFVALETAEDIPSGGPLCDDTLCDQLHRLLRAPDVEYNGHFGASIYFTLDIEEDTPSMHVKILDMINKQVELARESA